MNVIKQISWILLFFFLPTSFLFALQWTDLWRTADQQGALSLQQNKPQQAARVFKNKDWQAVALYRAGNYDKAFAQFSRQKTSDGHYNAGNAAAYLGHYQEAIQAYDKAIALNPNHTDAITNREIIKKLMDKKNQDSPKKDEKKKKDENKSNKSSSTEQNQTQNNNSSEKNKAQQNNQPNQPANPQKQTDHPSSQNNNQSSLPENKPLNSSPENKNFSSNNQQQAKEEEQKQLLRRLPDDPGGLLRQKFLRDYYRRHINETNEGELNAL